MEFKQVKELPEGLTSQAVEKAVRAFVEESHTEESGANPEGLYQQTLENIANTVIFGRDSNQVWLAHENGEVKAYAITYISKDVDNSFCYNMSQAWVHKEYRCKKVVKEWYQQLRAEAKRLGCRHIIVPSSRGVEAYLRFLGKGWKLYVSLLKEDI
jgi:hypothetical protein